MEKRMISFSPPDIGELEIQEVAEAMRSGWITTGPRTKELEKRFAEYFHVNKVVCLSSATAAEELNLRILGIGEGDEVIVPAYTYTATASAAIHVGAKVIFVDSQKDGHPVTHLPEMDYEKMEQAITEKTKAIVPVDLGGIMCDYDKIYEIVEKKKDLFRPSNAIQEAIGHIAVCTDSAHAVGASRHGKMAGEVADFTSYSFHAVKNFTTAEGGASTWIPVKGIDDEEIYKQFQLFSLHGQSKDALAKTKLGSWEYDIVGPCYKCNMTDITAAIGLKQLERYPGILARRKEMIGMYDKFLDELGVFHLNHYGDDYCSAGHLCLTRIPGITSDDRNDIITKMAERGIACNVHFKPLPMMTGYQKYGWDIKDFPNAYDYYANLVTLPLHTKLSDDDLTYIMENYKEVLQPYL